MFFLGLHVTEVAHDINQQVSRYVSQQLKIVNSYDTWHGMTTWMYQVCSDILLYYPGTKNVAKEMKKVSEGLVRNRGVTWFPELADKCSCVCVTLVYDTTVYQYYCVHAYTCMYVHVQFMQDEASRFTCTGP